MLQIHGVVLTDEGDLDYSAVENEHVVQHLQAQDSLVKVTLMQADLEWEYPQKLAKLMVATELELTRIRPTKRTTTKSFSLALLTCAS